MKKLARVPSPSLVALNLFFAAGNWGRKERRERERLSVLRVCITSYCVWLVSEWNSHFFSFQPQGSVCWIQWKRRVQEREGLPFSFISIHSNSYSHFSYCSLTVLSQNKSRCSCPSFSLLLLLAFFSTKRSESYFLPSEFFFISWHASEEVSVFLSSRKSYSGRSVTTAARLGTELTLGSWPRSSWFRRLTRPTRQEFPEQLLVNVLRHAFDAN